MSTSNEKLSRTTTKKSPQAHRKEGSRVTIVDIARELNLASSTVSRALNNHEGINASTRALVLETASRLGYRANASARSLHSGKTQSLGLIIPDIRMPFFAQIAKAAQARARISNLAVYIADSEYDTALELELISAMRQDVDGLLLCSPRSSDKDLLESTLGIPTVAIHREVQGISSVVTNQQDGMRQAISHLNSLGHTTIAYLSGPEGSWNASERLRAFKNLQPDHEGLIFGPIVDEFEGGRGYADAIFTSNATAVITYCDISALGLLARLKSRGISIPEQLSVVGFDGLDVSTITTPISSISLPRRLSAQTAVDLLKNTIEAPTAAHPGLITLPTELLVRESTSPILGLQ